MSAAQYESMKDAFESPDSSERIGIYRKMDEDEDDKEDGYEDGNEHGRANYAIVVRLPKDNKMLLSGAAAAISLGSAAIGYKAHEVQNRKKIDGKAQWLANYDRLLADAHYLHLLSKPTLKEKARVMNERLKHKTISEEQGQMARQELLTFINAIEMGRLLSSQGRYTHVQEWNAHMLKMLKQRDVIQNLAASIAKEYKNDETSDGVNLKRIANAVRSEAQDISHLWNLQ